MSFALRVPDEDSSEEMSLRSADAVLWDCARAAAAFAFIPLQVMATAAAAPIISRNTTGFTHFFPPFLPFPACAGASGAVSLLCLPGKGIKKRRASFFFSSIPHLTLNILWRQLPYSCCRSYCIPLPPRPLPLCRHRWKTGIEAPKNSG